MCNFSGGNHLRTSALVWAGLCGLLLGIGDRAAAQPGGRPRKVGDRYALLVGIDDFANINKLQFCGNDQVALRDELIRSGFPAENVYLLHDKAEENRYRPSKGNIEHQLDVVLKLAEPNDVLVLAFSGHGVQLGKQSYLCPFDAFPNDPKTLIPLDGIYERLRNCQASFKVMLVDACRNDPELAGGRSTVATDGMRQFARNLETTKPPVGMALLNSCAPGEVSWEDANFGHGVFMHFVLDGMRGAADADEDGFISLDELRRYAGTKTKTHVAHRFNRSQRPFLKSELENEALEFALIPVRTQGSVADVPPQRPGPTATPGLGPSAPKEITNSIGMKLVLIPAGEFQMGSPDSEEGRQDNEGPVHRVRITRPFHMGQFEVTQAEYERVMGTNPSKFSENGFSNRVSGMDTSRFPVDCVSWDDAQEFCRKLSVLEKNRAVRYRLPTEAEWEYACRAGTTTPFHCGRELTGRDANVNGKFPSGTTEEGPFLERTTTVGSYKPNAFGLYDMHGNVLEWCVDGYDSWYDPNSRVDDPQGVGHPRFEGWKPLRGGSWNDKAPVSRSARRQPWRRQPGSFIAGFRVVQVPGTE